MKNNIITLSNELGVKVKYEVIGVFDYYDKDYIALKELDTKDVLLMNYYEDKKGFVSIEPIESDEEFEIISEYFDLILETSCL